MKHLNIIKYSIFVIIMMIQLNAELKGQNALDLSFSCETGCIDLAINDGFLPYNVEWIYVDQSGTETPITLLYGVTGEEGDEDLCDLQYVGTYRVRVKDALCGVAEHEIEVNPCACIQISLSYLNNVQDCWDDLHSGGGSIGITITGTNNYTAVWSNGYTGTSPNKLGPGIYTVTVTSGPCEFVETFRICCCTLHTESTPYPVCNQNGLAITNVDLISPKTSTSFDGSIRLVVSGSSQITWYDENGTQIGYGRSITGLGPGIYCAQISNGCADYILECWELVDCSGSTLSISGSVINTCEGETLGSVSGSASGGIGPYKYKWSNGITSSTISYLPSGIYCVTVTDNVGCQASNCFSVGLNQIQVSRYGCTFTYRCNGIIINAVNIGSYSVTRVGDCRFRDHYCNDGLFLFSEFLGTNFVNVGGCTVNEICNSNGQIFNVHRGTFVTQQIGPAFGHGPCFACHDRTFCSYPTLPFTTNSSVVFVGSATQNQHGGDCNLANDTWDCLTSFTCRGINLGQFCVEGCFMTSCNIPPALPPNAVADKQLLDSEFEHSLDNLNFNIYPNPTTGILNLFLTNSNDFSLNDLNIKIFSFDGSLISNTQNPQFYGNTFELNTHEFISGPYKLIVSLQGKIVYHTTFIKY